MLNHPFYRGRGEPDPIWLFDDSAIPKTDKERIEELEDELRRWKNACEYWRLLYEKEIAK